MLLPKNLATKICKFLVSTNWQIPTDYFKRFPRLNCKLQLNLFGLSKNLKMAFFGHKHELKILLFSLTGNSLNVTILYLISEQKFNQMKHPLT